MNEKINKKFLFTILLCISLVLISAFVIEYKFGQKIGPFLDKQGTKWSIIIAFMIILIAIGIYFLFSN